MPEVEFETLEEAADAFAELSGEMTAVRKALLETMRIVSREHPNDFKRLVKNLGANRDAFRKIGDEETTDAFSELLNEMQVRSILG